MAQCVISKVSNTLCPSHSSNPIAMICVTCDNRYVCLECIATTHSGHQFWVLQKYIATQREKTISLLQEAKTKVKSGKERLKFIDKTKQRNKIFFNSVTNGIRDNENYLKNEIAKISASHISACKGSFDKNMELLESLEENLQQAVEELNQSLEVCQNAVDSKTYEDFAPLNENIQKCIERDFELLSVLQQQTFVKPEATEKEIKHLCGEIWQSDWEPEEPMIPVLSKNNDYEETLPKFQLPSLPHPPIPRTSENIAEHFDVPLLVLTIEKVGQTSVDLSWNRSGNYTIEKRRKGILKNWQKCAAVLNPLMSYTVRDLKEGHEFQFRLVYVDGDSNDKEKYTEPTKYVKLPASDLDYEFPAPSATAQPLVTGKRERLGQKQIVCATADNIAKDDKELTYRSDFEIQRWFFGDLGRKEAERFLTPISNEPGTFLIRKSETKPGTFVLSVKDFDTTRGAIVKHYKVLKTADDLKYYITEKLIFSTLPELVAHYQGAADVLCRKITKPCPNPTTVFASVGGTWAIKRDALTFSERLGAGQSGEVWKGMWNRNTPIAIKTLKEGTMSPEAFLAEAEIMKQCKHDHLLRLFGVCSEKEPIYIVTELMSQGSLLDFLRNENNSRLPLATKVNFAAQIASGMSFLENKKFIHCDLAARNILVGDNDIVKVADFRLSRLLVDDEYNPETGFKFPIKWTAPEAALYGKFTIKSDVWSYGILLTEIASMGKFPYPGMTNMEVLEKVENGYRMKNMWDCPDDVYQVMRSCWDREPKQRPSFDYLSHYFNDYVVQEGGQARKYEMRNINR